MLTSSTDLDQKGNQLERKEDSQGPNACRRDNRRSSSDPAADGRNKETLTEKQNRIYKLAQQFFQKPLFRNQSYLKGTDSHLSPHRRPPCECASRGCERDTSRMRVYLGYEVDRAKQIPTSTSLTCLKETVSSIFSRGRGDYDTGKASKRNEASNANSKTFLMRFFNRTSPNRRRALEEPGAKPPPAAPQPKAPIPGRSPKARLRQDLVYVNQGIDSQEAVPLSESTDTQTEDAKQCPTKSIEVRPDKPVTGNQVVKGKDKDSQQRPEDFKANNHKIGENGNQYEAESHDTAAFPGSSVPAAISAQFANALLSYAGRSTSGTEGSGKEDPLGLIAHTGTYPAKSNNTNNDSLPTTVEEPPHAPLRRPPTREELRAAFIKMASRNAHRRPRKLRLRSSSGRTLSSGSSKGAISSDSDWDLDDIDFGELLGPDKKAAPTKLAEPEFIPRCVELYGTPQDPFIDYYYNKEDPTEGVPPYQHAASAPDMCCPQLSATTSGADDCSLAKRCSVPDFLARTLPALPAMRLSTPPPRLPANLHQVKNTPRLPRGRWTPNGSPCKSD